MKVVKAFAMLVVVGGSFVGLAGSPPTAETKATYTPAAASKQPPAVKLGCEKYGCADCSCIAARKEVMEKMPKTLLQIKKLLVANGIPPEAVVIELKGYKGPDKSEDKRLPDATIASCKCSLDCLCCKWSFPL